MKTFQTPICLYCCFNSAVTPKRSYSHFACVLLHHFCGRAKTLGGLILPVSLKWKFNKMRTNLKLYKPCREHWLQTKSTRYKVLLPWQLHPSSFLLRLWAITILTAFHFVIVELYFTCRIKLIIHDLNLKGDQNERTGVPSSSNYPLISPCCCCY